MVISASLKLSAKSSKQKSCPAVLMGLKNAPQSFGLVMFLYRLERCPYLGRVMGIIVENGYAVDLRLEHQPAVNARKAGQ